MRALHVEPSSMMFESARAPSLLLRLPMYGVEPTSYELPVSVFLHEPTDFEHNEHTHRATL